MPERAERIDPVLQLELERLARNGLIQALANYHDIVIEGGQTFTTYNRIVIDDTRREFYEHAVKTAHKHIWPGK